MKTQIIQLDKNDDCTSVCDKMSWSQTGRILLVWPHKGHLLDQRLELNLVKRNASRRGAQLALVTNEPNVQFIARQLDIPVFDNLALAQGSSWEEGKKLTTKPHFDQDYPNLEKIRNFTKPAPRRWINRPAIRLVCLGISVSALLMLAIFILPSATIMLARLVATQSTILSLTGDPTVTNINFSTGSLPTYYQEVIVEGHDNLIVTGSVIVPNQVAFGELLLTNISDHPISLPLGTIVSTTGGDPIRFSTLSTDEIWITPGGSAYVNARAIVPGKSGNLPPDTLVAIQGEYRLYLTVTNPNATAGGTDASVPSPTEQDLVRLRERLSEKLEQTALIQLRTRIPSDDMLITPAVRILEILDESSTPAVGEPGRELDLSLRILFQIQVVPGQALRDWVTPILDSNIQIGYSPIDNTLIFTPLAPPTLGEDGNVHVTIRAERKVQTIIDTNQVINLVKGSPIQQAINHLQKALPLAQKAHITLVPKWWPWLPFLPMRIQVIQ